MIFEPQYIIVPGGDRLHLMRICTDPSGHPVLMIHEVIENGKIFY